jgi:hypothetical protein
MRFFTRPRMPTCQPLLWRQCALARKSVVDLLADFDKTKRYTLLTMGRLESRLADLLGTRVELSSPDWLKESVKKQVLREAVLPFSSLLYLKIV